MRWAMRDFVWLCVVLLLCGMLLLQSQRCGEVHDGTSSLLSTLQGPPPPDTDPMDDLERRDLEAGIRVRGSCNVLVFASYDFDYDFFVRTNPEGMIRFVVEQTEYNVELVRKAIEKNPNLVVFAGQFGTRGIEWFVLWKDVRAGSLADGLLELHLPSDIEQTDWDVIVVDGPEDSAGGPGRAKAIHKAWQLSRAGSKVTDVFIHDVLRPSISSFAELFFPLSSFVRQTRTLRHYRVHPQHF